MINKILLVTILFLSWMGAAVGDALENDLLAHARIYIKAGEPDKAMQQLKKLLVSAPDSVAARFLQARLYSEQGKTEMAIAGYEALIKDHPNLAEAYNNLAALFVRKNDLRQAKLVLEQGMQTHAAYASLYRNISAVYMEMARKSYTEARLLKQEMKPLELHQLPDLVETKTGGSAASSR